MKKVICIILATLMLCGVCACGKTKPSSPNSSLSLSSVGTSVPEDFLVQEESSISEETASSEEIVSSKETTSSNTTASSEVATGSAKKISTGENGKDTRNGTLINIKNGWVYYVDMTKITDIFQGAGSGGHLYRVKADGSKTECLSTKVCDDVQIVGDYVYYLAHFSDDGWDKHAYADLYRMKLDGSGNMKLKTGIPSIFSYFVSGDYVYMDGSGNVKGYGCLFRARTDGSDCVKISEHASCNTMVAEGNLYSEIQGFPNYFNKMDTNGENYVRIFNGDLIDSYFYYQGRFYYVKDSHSTICSCKMDGSDEIVIAQTSNTYQYMPVGNWVYYLKYSKQHDTDCVHRTTLDGKYTEIIATERFVPSYVFGDQIYGDVKGTEAKHLRWNGTSWSVETVKMNKLANAATENTAYPGGHTGTEVVTPKPVTLTEGVPLYFVNNQVEMNSLYAENRSDEEIQIMGLNREAKRRFIITKDENDPTWYNIHLENTDLYLGVSGGSQEKGTKIITWKKTGGESQRVRFISAGEPGCYYIQAYGGLCWGLFIDAFLENEEGRAKIWLYNELY